jgi:hypothetical protein
MLSARGLGGVVERGNGSPRSGSHREETDWVLSLMWGGRNTGRKMYTSALIMSETVFLVIYLNK